jgi:hypothetical protein
MSPDILDDRAIKGAPEEEIGRFRRACRHAVDHAWEIEDRIVLAALRQNDARCGRRRLPQPLSSRLFCRRFTHEQLFNLAKCQPVFRSIRFPNHISWYSYPWRKK